MLCGVTLRNQQKDHNISSTVKKSQNQTYNLAGWQKLRETVDYQTVMDFSTLDMYGEFKEDAKSVLVRVMDNLQTAGYSYTFKDGGIFLNERLDDKTIQKVLVFTRLFNAHFVAKFNMIMLHANCI